MHSIVEKRAFAECWRRLGFSHSHHASGVLGSLSRPFWHLSAPEASERGPSLGGGLKKS